MTIEYEDNPENISLAQSIAKIESTNGIHNSIMVIRCHKSKKIFVCESDMIRNFEEKLFEFFKGKKII